MPPIYFHTDCRQFRGDRPCAPHKREGVYCEGCAHYDPVKTRILVVKLDAVGDVLRTTCILPGLRAKHPGAWIDWLTKRASLPLFENNPLVDRVLPLSEESVVTLGTQDYDLVVNLDAAPLSARLATKARAKARIGFGFDPAGFVFPWNEEARDWYEMGLLDDVKKRNTETYQRIVARICGLSPEADLPVLLYLSEGERASARARAAGWGIPPGVPVVGLNTGAGGRWEHKKWTEGGFVALAAALAALPAPAPRVLLLGGPEERERNARLAAAVGGGVVDTGTGHSLREFSAIVDLCDVVVTGDTMALHIAVALGKKVVGLFGPTSAAEIDLYGRGVKVTSDVACLNCYRSSCDERPTCMERIDPATVLSAVQGLL